MESGEINNNNNKNVRLTSSWLVHAWLAWPLRPHLVLPLYRDPSTPSTSSDYPPLDHPLSHKPYSPRVPREVEDDPEHDPERNQLTNFQSSSPTHKPGNLIPSANGLNGQSRRENDEGVPIVNGYAV